MRTDLNQEQMNAVQNMDRACLVRANVGSGKTTVLTEKVRYLHEEKQVPYEDMAVLTFTNRAADEIRNRLGIGGDTLRLCGTFHSVAMTLLREDLPLDVIGFHQDFQIITPEEELELAQLLIREHKLKIKYPNRLKKRLEENGSSRGPAYDDDFSVLAALLADEKKNSGRMNFDELIENTAVLGRGIHVKWVIVDEVQDCDRKQLDMIDALMGEDTSLFAVGDPSQMIYGWRSASLNVFFILQDRYHATVLDLPRNYRCSDEILKAARRFQQSGAPVEGARGEGKKIPVHMYYDPFAEAGSIAQRILTLHDERKAEQEDGNRVTGSLRKNDTNEGREKGTLRWSDFAVLYRLQEQAPLIQKRFEEAGIPCEISQKKKLQDIPVLVWLARTLRAALNRKDQASRSLALEDKRFAGKKKQQLEEIIDAFAAQYALFAAGDMQTDELAQLLWDCLQLDHFIRPADADFRENRQYVMAFLERLCEMKDLREGLNQSALAGTEFVLEKPREDAVRLMTLHASKGLEFEVVFIVGINNGLLPLRGKGSDQEEEMRLFYVGLTRAKDMLELSCCMNPGMAKVESGEGMFLRMIPPALLVRDDRGGSAHSLTDLRNMILEERRNVVAESQGKESYMEENTEEAADENEAEEEVSSRRVRHPHYGIGTVVWEDGMNIKVDFENYGEKEFIIAFSQLIEA